MSEFPDTPTPRSVGYENNLHPTPEINVHNKLTSLDAASKTFVGGVTETSEKSQVLVKVGQKVGKYEVRAQLGAGGMGAVYLAFDPLIEREVALKVLSADLQSSPDALQRFLAEARAIGRLNHSHVVSIYDIDQFDGHYFLVMELVSGGSVSDRLKQERLPWTEACRIVAQAARGLFAAHAAGLIHRDIKPENLMLAKDGTVKVVDFGLSKLMDISSDAQASLTKVGQILGTPQYMSPEQFEGGEIDVRTDIYSLGATLFRLLTARFPYHECTTILQVMSAHLTKPAPVASATVPSIPQECDQIIARAMSKKPDDRYATAAQLADELESLLRKIEDSDFLTVNEIDSSDRRLQTVLIVEPSKLQAAIIRDAFVQAGVDKVEVVGSLEAAQKAVKAGVPDLLFTAMQLPDGEATEFLRDLCQGSRMHNSAIVVSSSDVTLQELAHVGNAACLIQAPKKVRAEDILRVIHAIGPSIISAGPMSSSVEPATMRLQIVLDSGKIPNALAEMLREIGLFDVEVSIDPWGYVPLDPPASLVLFVRRSEVHLQNTECVSLTRLTGEQSPMTAVIQVDRDRMVLRAVRRYRIVAICQRVLAVGRLNCLLQGCRQ